MDTHRYRPAAQAASRRRSRALLFAIAGLFVVPAAHAALPICVATVNGGLDIHDYGLNSAFQTANTGPEGSTQEIRLRPGTYQLNGDLKFNPDGSHDNKSFKLSGGWDATCQNQTGKPTDTIVRGVPSNPYISKFEFTGDNARYEISNLRFEQFAHFVIDDKHCDSLSICPDTDTISVERVIFHSAGFIRIFAYDAKRVTFRNNLVTALEPADSDEPLTRPLTISVHNNEDPPQVTFNTLNLRCFNGGAGLNLFSAQPDMALHHNIVTSVDCNPQILISNVASDDAGFQHGSMVTPYYNLFGSIDGSYDGDLVGNGNIITTNVKYVDDIGGNYRLQNTSPAANGGASLLDVLQSGFVVSPLDLDGNPRPFSVHFDIGAYESFAFDGTPPLITVNSANDVDDGTCDATHCSLREAINLANTQTGSSQRIVFDIPGSCPRVIAIDSELPDVTDSLAVDGYTQPDANPNSLDVGSDANLCIAITPGNTGVAHALAVTSGAPAATRLVVRGLAFGNGFYTFGTDAIDLRGGSGHRIIGNAFGGYFPSTLAPIGSLPRAVLVRGTATNVVIGTFLPADRNYLGNLTQNGIVLNDATSTGHRIENNYIGVQPNGLTAQPNQADGISASGGSNVTINGNTIIASDYGISLLGADTTKFTITHNNVGVNALGIGNNPTLSNAVGIVVALGSNAHIIGAAATDTLQISKHSNFVDNNLGDGILLADDAGPTNTIRGNIIGSNGKSGSGIGIDLGGSQAQLANDVDDADTGPNALQNYPVIKGSAPVNASTRQVRAFLNTAPGQAVRVDFYQGFVCTAKGADARNFVGSVDANSGATGRVAITASITEYGGYLTATATNAAGQTSELAPCVPEDVIFRDGVE